jgi:hypothetical protein
VKGAPGSFLGGAPRRCGSASVVQRPRGSRGSRKSRNSSARARDWRGGDGLRGVWLVGGGGRGGGEMVLGSGGEGRMVFAGDGFAFCFRLVFLSVYIQTKKNVCLFHCLKSKL